MSKIHQRDCKRLGTCDKIFYTVSGLVCLYISPAYLASVLNRLSPSDLGEWRGDGTNRVY